MDYVICINNQDYPVSLEVKKIYEVIPDKNAEKHQLIRIVDESGEDYLYPISYFKFIEVPEEIKQLFGSPDILV